MPTRPHQKKYIGELADLYNVRQMRKVQSPLDDSVILGAPTPEAADAAKHLQYRQLIGSLLYIAGATRPDIAFAISKLSRYLSSYSQIHYDQALSHLTEPVGLYETQVLSWREP